MITRTTNDHQGLSGTHTRRLARSLAATAALAIVTAIAPTTGSTAAASRGAEPGTVTTPFALNGLGFGTELTGGSVPADSSRTALVVIGCTREAGLDLNRGVAGDDLDGQGQASGISTRAWTTKVGGVVTSHARSRINDFDADNENGTFSMEGLVVTTRTWNDATGFHREHSFRLRALSAQVAGEDVPGLPAPADIEPGQSIEIPGVASVTFDVRTGRVTQTDAEAVSTGAVIEVAGGSTISAAHAQSAISDKPTGGMLGGRAESIRGSGQLTSRNAVKQGVPCDGTGGEWINRSGAGYQQAGLDIGASNVGALGDQLGRDRAVARTRARTDRLSIGDGEIVVTAIRSQANVVRDGDRYTRTPSATGLGSLTIGGEEQELPQLGEPVLVPGVARITSGVVELTPRGITVVGLRVKLLGGDDMTGVYDIARSSVEIDPS